MENGFQSEQFALYENQKNSGESKQIYNNCKKNISIVSQKAFSQSEETKVINKKHSSKNVKFIITAVKNEEKARKKRSPKKPKNITKIKNKKEKTQFTFIKAENKRLRQKSSKTPKKPKSKLMLFKVDKIQEIKKKKRNKFKDKNNITNTGLTIDDSPNEIFENINLLNEESNFSDLYSDEKIGKEDCTILSKILSNHQRHEPRFNRPERPGFELEPPTKAFTIKLKEIK